jgi:hypothetical protein
MNIGMNCTVKTLEIKPLLGLKNYLKIVTYGIHNIRISGDYSFD